MKALATALAAIGTIVVGHAATAAPAPLYGNVVSVTPVTAQITVPQQQCSDQPGYVQRPTTGGGAVVGGVLGGLAGNAIGAGAGRAVATGVGVITGAIAGNSVEAANTPPVPVTTTNCVYSQMNQTRIVAYDVTYEFNGERYTTRTAQDPGARIALAVQPTGGSPYDAPPPAGGPTPMTAPSAPYGAPYPAPAYPAYPPYNGPPAYDYPPFGYGYYGYPGPPVYIEGGFYGGWRGRRGR